MTLEIFIDTRIDSLVDRLADGLAGPRTDPFVAEMVVVPSAGMRRWLEQQLASRLGVAANIEMVSPAHFTDRVKAQSGLGPSPWTIEAMTAQILAVAHDHHSPPNLRELLHAGSSPATHLVPRARAIANLFDRYHRHRPAMIRSWATSRDASNDLDGDGHPLGPHQRWQPQLWRQIRPHLGVSPPETLPAVVDTLANGSPLPAFGDGSTRADSRTDTIDPSDVSPIASSPPCSKATGSGSGSRSRSGIDATDLAAPGPVTNGRFTSRPRVPTTIQLFALTVMTAELRSILNALATRRAVRIFATASSSASLPNTSAEPNSVGPNSVEANSADEPTGHHPLLNIWGRTKRRGLRSLVMATENWHPQLAGTPRRASLPGEHPATVLGAVQHQILTDAPPNRPRSLAPSIAPNIDPNIDPNGQLTTDTSISFHGCSGDARQVEVLRDAILMLLRDNPDLTEADITVMCPRLARFAPLIEAIWGPGAQHSTPNPSTSRPSTANQNSANGHTSTSTSGNPARSSVDTARSAATAGSSVPSGLPAPALRYRINFGTLRTAAPLLDSLAQLLTLLTGRFTASQLRTFLSLGPVRRRFGLDDPYDLGTATGWFDATALRWGLDVDHRNRHSDLPPDYRSHTLDSTAEAVLGSLALPSHEVIPGGPAAVQVDLSSYEIAGQLARFSTVLSEAHQTLVVGGLMSMSEWCSQLFTVAETFLAVAPAEAWQWERLTEVLNSLADASTDAALTIHEVSALFCDTIVARAGHRTYGSGAMVVDTPEALRTIPHRVVCVLGFDDDALPQPRATIDDLIAAHPQPADVSPADDAKQQLLDAVLAARDHLVVTFSDRDVHTNAHIQPSTALKELLDVVATTTGAAPQDLIRPESRFAFSEINFLEPARSFDGRACAASMARRERPVAVERSLPDPLPANDRDTDQPMSPRDLVRAAVCPTDVVVEDSLGVRFPRIQDLPGDLLPVELNSLEKWSLGNDLLARAVRLGASPTASGTGEWLKEKRAAGLLPPGVLADNVAQEVVDKVDKIVAAVQAEVGRSGTDLVAALVPAAVAISREVRLPASAGTDPVTISILGAIECRHGGPSRVFYSARKRKDEIQLWVETLLMADCGLGDRAWLIDGRADVFRCEIRTGGIGGAGARGANGAANEDAAAAIRAAVRYLAGLYQRARREVVPVFAELSHELAKDNPKLYRLNNAWFRSGGSFASGDRTKNSVALLFDNWTLDDVLGSEHGVAEAAQELYGHINATTSVWGD